MIRPKFGLAAVDHAGGRSLATYTVRRTIRPPTRRGRSRSPRPYPARYANDSFNYTYTSLLKSLHATFNGRPDLLTTAVGLMESCKQQALELGTLPIGDDNVAGPSFQYRPT